MFNFVKSFLIISTFCLLIIILLEGVFSYYYSLNFASTKDKRDTYKENTISRSDDNSIDPYNNKLKTVHRKLANRYTFASQGRWAPNTLARQYNYDKL